MSDGNLVLTSVKREYRGFAYVSGWVDTKGKFGASQGRFESRAKLPYGTGLWPAHVRWWGAGLTAGSRAEGLMCVRVYSG